MRQRILYTVLPAIIFFSITATKIFATTFIVKNSGDISLNSSKAQAGDTLLMQNGIWTNQKIVFSCSGTRDKPIYLLAETPGEVILTGTSTLRISGSYLTVGGVYFKDGYSSSGAVVEFRNGSNEANYCRLTNSAIVDYNPQDNTVDYKWISLYGSHNRVDHCYLAGKTNSGTTLVVWLTNHPNYHEIDHNYFGPRPVLGVNGAETIRVGTSDWSMYDSYTTVEYNYFDKCDGEIEIISNKSCHNTYRYNTFYKCAGTLTLRHGNYCTVEGNYFFGGYKSNTGGIRIIGENHKVYNNYLTELSGDGFRSAISLVNGIPDSPLNGYFQVKYAVVAFNTLINNKRSFTFGAGSSSQQSMPPINCIVANNLVETKYSPMITYEDTPDSLTWEGNIFYGASLGIAEPNGIKLIDPKLNTSVDSLWKLTKDSPAVDSALGSFPEITTDFDGQTRGSLKDIGSDEYSDSTITHTPAGPEDAGPDWNIIITGIKSGSRGIGNEIRSFSLRQNYPNPFNPSTKIEFSLPQRSFISLRIFDLKGSLVETLFNGEREKGNYSIRWKPENLASGIYFYRLRTNKTVITRKMIFLK